MCFALTLACTLLCDYLFSVTDYTTHVAASDVARYIVSLNVRESGHETSCNLTMRVTRLILEQGQCSYSRSLVPRSSPTFSLITCSM